MAMNKGNNEQLDRSYRTELETVQSTWGSSTRQGDDHKGKQHRNCAFEAGTILFETRNVRGADDPCPLSATPAPSFIPKALAALAAGIRKNPALFSHFTPFFRTGGTSETDFMQAPSILALCSMLLRDFLFTMLFDSRHARRWWLIITQKLPKENLSWSSQDRVMDIAINRSRLSR